MIFGWMKPAIKKASDRAGLLRHLARKSQAGGDKSFGMAYVKDGKGTLVRYTGPASQWLEQNAKELEKIALSEVILGHCRWPTQGAITKNNTHPFSIGDSYAVHNGQIKNGAALHAKARHVARGETDSEEALCYIVGEDFSSEALAEIEGYFAFGSIKKDGSQTVLACDDRARLHLAWVGDGCVWATDLEVLRSSLAAIGVEPEGIRIQSQVIRLPGRQVTELKSRTLWPMDETASRSLFGDESFIKKH